MENRTNISIELQTISPAVAEIAPVNPFYLPEGYFEGLAGEILQLVSNPEISPVLMDASGNPYNIPEDYFEKLPQQLLSRIRKGENPEILKDAGDNPFKIPNGYFEGLAESILNRVKGEETISAKEELSALSPLLSKLDKTTLYSIPTGYFDESTAHSIAAIQAVDLLKEELENISPLMSSLRTKTTYKIPSRYFEGLPLSVLNKIKGQSSAKIIPVTFVRKVMRYAAAAVIAGIVISAGLLFQNKKSSTEISAAVVKTDEMLEQETQKGVKGLSDDEIFNFVENNTASLPDPLSMASSVDIDSEDVKLMLTDIPDSELKQFLVEYGDAKEALTN